MITEDYCSFEVAKLLEEKGFDEPCYGIWHIGNKLFDINYEPLDYSELREERLLAPTHQMAMKWLREKHNIIIVIEPHSYNHMEEKTSSYDFSIWYGDNYEHPLTTNYSTYEEAVEAAILYVLSEVL